MPHVLARLRGAPLDAVRQQLQQDAAQHAADGMRLAHLWQNADDPAEVLFLFRVDDLAHCQRLTRERHARARQQHPDAPLPEMTFLQDT